MLLYQACLNWFLIENWCLNDVSIVYIREISLTFML